MALRYFKDNPTLNSRALQIWQILISKAHNRETITYEALAELLEYKGVGVLGRQLGRIWAFCKYHDLPPLTVLVVGKHTGKPGPGLEEYKDIEGTFDQAREDAFGHNWYRLYPPSEAGFAETWKAVTQAQ
jgi:hypothetical protein